MPDWAPVGGRTNCDIDDLMLGDAVILLGLCDVGGFLDDHHGGSVEAELQGVTSASWSAHGGGRFAGQIRQALNSGRLDWPRGGVSDWGLSPLSIARLRQ
ncbi:hypothetical protein ACT17_08200 [Mycolicibacterium conceptionense]|uniref:Uncharacterized protein n=2 Tax=Mycolicibacterium TaxID=1866885 RepID=A0ABR5FZ67_9MYCO|nr:MULTISPECIES: hypothetical protein [Mycolicibacterium]KLI10006.1 hypothetical protein AA982_01275 [Mycolicibacterium senegalense]KLO53246.1 hypothetical protein ABW05_18840 [Mycolicibacterium senegalense]KMV18869.1 hypothetical protein ACT17_08200 [Mycolicibacterium conceptionense]